MSKLKNFFVSTVYIAGIATATLGAEKLVEAAKLNGDIGAAKTEEKAALERLKQNEGVETYNILREQWHDAANARSQKEQEGDAAAIAGLLLAAGGMTAARLANVEKKKKSCCC